jgi:hypothetical protein
LAFSDWKHHPRPTCLLKHFFKTLDFLWMAGRVVGNQPPVRFQDFLKLRKPRSVLKAIAVEENQIE